MHHYYQLQQLVGTVIDIHVAKFIGEASTWYLTYLCKWRYAAYAPEGWPGVLSEFANDTERSISAYYLPASSMCHVASHHHPPSSSTSRIQHPLCTPDTHDCVDMAQYEAIIAF